VISCRSLDDLVCYCPGTAGDKLEYRCPLHVYTCFFCDPNLRDPPRLMIPRQVCFLSSSETIFMICVDCSTDDAPALSALSGRIQRSRPFQSDKNGRGDQLLSCGSVSLNTRVAVTVLKTAMYFREVSWFYNVFNAITKSQDQITIEAHWMCLGAHLLIDCTQQDSPTRIDYRPSWQCSTIKLGVSVSFTRSTSIIPSSAPSMYLNH
jgi:hypothetical protein